MSFQRVERGYWVWVALLACTASAQTVNNQTLTGNYYFRQVSLGTDGASNLTDARSMIGTLTFDGTGHYTFSGQMAVGSGSPSSLSGNGAYSVDPAGFVSIDSPIRSGEKVNARYGAEAVVGSNTESSANTFDLFVAIPAPATPATTSSLSGSYWAATLEFPGASLANARNTIFNFNASGTGTFTNFSVNGHAANLSAGQPTTQQVTGGTYTAAADGTITANFGTATPTALLSGTRTVYVSKGGNIVLGGSGSSHDILIAVKAISGATNATWSGSFWGAGLRHDATTATGFAGSAIAGGAGKLIWTRRLKVLGVGNVDFTGVNSYSLNANGSGTAELAQIALGTGGVFIGSEINPNDAAGYEIYCGVQMPALSGTGLWINPQGVINPTSFSPTGNPISPGGFIRIYGAGFATTSQSATPPYPPTLNGVTVLINNQPAAIYFVTPTTVDFVVPWATQGPTATVVVQSGAKSSNTVTVPVAATAPGILSVQQNGTGPGVMQHADYTTVTPDHPAVGGETVVIYVTGLGAVKRSVLVWNETLPARIYRVALDGGRRELARELKSPDSAGILYGWLTLTTDGRFYLHRYRRALSSVNVVTFGR